MLAGENPLKMASSGRQVTVNHQSCMLSFFSGRRVATNDPADMNLLVYQFCLSPI